MSITNISKPSSSMTNQTKINIGETWETIDSTWATETRTWGDMASLINNITKISNEFLATELSDYLVTEDNNYLVISDGFITNIAKP